MNRPENRITHLEDVEAIIHMLTAYPYAVDGKDIDLLRPLYTDDARLAVSETGIELASAWASGTYLLNIFKGIDNVRHKIVNLGIDEGEDEGWAILHVCGL